jgi:hypothetical protein
MADYASVWSAVPGPCQRGLSFHGRRIASAEEHLNEEHLKMPISIPTLPVIAAWARV